MVLNCILIKFIFNEFKFYATLCNLPVSLSDVMSMHPSSSILGNWNLNPFGCLLFGGINFLFWGVLISSWSESELIRITFVS